MSPTGESAHLTLYAEDEATQTFPISFTLLDASIRKLRRGKYSILHNEMHAVEFQVDVLGPSKRLADSAHQSGTPPVSEHQQPYTPFYELWVSEDGILLSASDAQTKKEFIRLVQFKKRPDF